MPKYAYRRHVRWLHMGKGPIQEARTVTVSPAEPPKVEKTEVEETQEVDLSTLTKADLVDLADQRGVDTSGTKADILERLNGG